MKINSYVVPAKTWTDALKSLAFLSLLIWFVTKLRTSDAYLFLLTSSMRVNYWEFLVTLTFLAKVFYD